MKKTLLPEPHLALELTIGLRAFNWPLAWAIKLGLMPWIFR